MRKRRKGHWEIKEKVTTRLEEVIVVVTFSYHYRAIGIRYGEWVILCGDTIIKRIDEDAMYFLKQLPDDPMDYKPYNDYINNKYRRLKLVK